MLPPPKEFATFLGNEFAQKLLRNAVICFVSSAVSDTCSNSIRVIKVRGFPALVSTELSLFHRLPSKLMRRRFHTGRRLWRL